MLLLLVVLGCCTALTKAESGQLLRLQLLRSGQRRSGALVSTLSNGTSSKFQRQSRRHERKKADGVKFGWNAKSFYKTELVLPYMMCGEAACPGLGIGTHAIAATMFNATHSSAPYKVTFSIVNGLPPPKVPKGPTKRPTRAPALRLTRTPTPFQRILIRCGSGAAYTDALGRQWLGDQYYSKMSLEYHCIDLDQNVLVHAVAVLFPQAHIMRCFVSNLCKPAEDTAKRYTARET
jgi:hypothetical protein